MAYGQNISSCDTYFAAHNMYTVLEASVGMGIMVLLQYLFLLKVYWTFTLLHSTLCNSIVAESPTLGKFVGNSGRKREGGKEKKWKREGKEEEREGVKREKEKETKRDKEIGRNKEREGKKRERERERGRGMGKNWKGKCCEREREREREKEREERWGK